MGRRALGAVAAVVLVLAGCGGTPAAENRSEVVPRHQVPTGEPAAGLAVVRSTGEPVGLQAVDDKVLLTYHSDGDPDRCYFRWVSATGTVGGTFLPNPLICWLAVGSGRTYLALDPDRPLRDSLDLSDLAHPVRVDWNPTTEAVERGDLALGRCLDLLPNPVNETGACAYSPRRHEIYHPDPPGLLAIDARGRVWSLDTDGAIAVTDGHRTRRSHPLPGPPAPDTFVTSSDRAGFWTGEGSLVVTDDAGAHWHEVETLPSGMQGAAINFLPDGRFLFVPEDGPIYRARDAAATAFDRLPAGPVEQAVVAGHLVYGATAGGPYATVSERVWVSKDAGTTWRPLVDGDLVLEHEPAVSADRLTQVPNSEARRIIDHSLRPAGAAVGAGGQVLISYTDPRYERWGWRLFDRGNHLLGEGLDPGAADPRWAGKGFVLDGRTFVGTDGRTAAVAHSATPQDPVAGDVYLRAYGMFRASEHKIFPGAASSTDKVTAQDNLGQLWALAREQHGHTVVLSARAGGPWHSRDLGPGIGAKAVQGRGSTLMVAGRTQMYLSTDAGRSWRLVTHHAMEYAGGTPTFTVLPDGTIVGGDDRGGLGVSTDGRTFYSAGPYQGPDWLTLGEDLFRRTVHGRLEVSRDREHWRVFSLRAVRALVPAPMGQTQSD